MKRIKILSLITILICFISCDIVVENVKERATKILEEKKVAIDSTLNNEIDNTINQVDTLLNHQKK
jgi:cellobiose-specific phosphotransferase system component IIB